jgi:hypothetical protein
MRERMRVKRKKSWKVRVVSILIVLGAVWLVYVVAMNWMAWHFAQEAGQAHQNLRVVPTPLRDNAIEELKGRRVEKFGFSFQVPWNETERETNGSSVAVLTSKEAGLVLFDPVTEGDGAKIMRGKTIQEFRLMTKVFGSRTLSSNYELMAAAVQTTPSNVRWWAGRSRNVRNLILLMDKSLDLADATAIHEIHRGSMRGFQFGDPSTPPYQVNLNLFDESDRHYKIWISSRNKSAPCITQAQINGLVASFRGLPTRPVSIAPTNGD